MAPVLHSSNIPTNIPSLSPLRTSSSQLTPLRRRRPIAALRRCGGGRGDRRDLHRPGVPPEIRPLRCPHRRRRPLLRCHRCRSGRHMDGSQDAWELCRRSKQLLEELARGLEAEGKDPLQEIGWKRTGNWLIGKTLEEQAMLEKRVKLLRDAGLDADYLSSMALQSEEPELDAGERTAAFCPDDCRIDAWMAVSFIEKCNRDFSSEGKYSEFYNNPAIRLSSTPGEVEAVERSENILYGTRAIIIATGAWSGPVIKSLVMSDD